MKNRILDQLELYANHKPGDKLQDMQFELCETLNISPETLAGRSKRVLKDILHNYGAFAVETIDSFNHRILRTFAKDLGLRSDFEVTTEADLLLQQAVDGVLAKTGSDEFLTETLVNFALQKTTEDRSWDPTYQLLEKAKILIQEQSLEPLQRLQSKTVDDFKQLTKTIISLQRKAKEELNLAVKRVVELMESRGLDEAHFNRGSYPKHIKALLGSKAVRWDGWRENIEEHAFYTKGQDEAIKAAIDEIKTELIDLFHSSKQAYQNADWYTRLYREIVPMTVLNYIQNEYKTIKEEQNLVTVAEFNRRIHQEVKSQPVPFIYERLGDRYRHFYIDEFQDTSQMQWQNLLPLVDNALAQQDRAEQPGSLLLVGDAKQSIYRWRGGEPEQFVRLSHGESPFALMAQLERLTKNWRSFSEIIHFNNQLFKHLGQHLPEGPYRDLYTLESAQETNKKQGGFVSLEFFEANNNSDREPIYLEKVKARISACLQQGYSLKDICILTRKKDHSKVLAAALQEDYAVVSPDSLLVKESGLVDFMLSALELARQPLDRETRLNFIWNYFEVSSPKADRHALFSLASGQELSDFFQALKQLDISFSLDRFNSFGLYESLEYLIRSFKLQSKITAYERHFLELARSFEQQNKSAGLNFLEDWKKQEDAASLQFPDALDAIRLMTVHKAKGLEFPVVIVPYTDADLINTRNENLWYGVDPQQYAGFSEIYLPLNSLKNKDPELYEAYLEQRFFDELNVYYVALTRAEEQLHIISSAKKAETRTFGGLLRDYLDQDPNQNSENDMFEWGVPIQRTAIPESEATIDSEFISTDKAQNRIRLVATPRDKYKLETLAAQDRGNRLHLWLSKLDSAEELPILFQRLEVLARNDSQQLIADQELLRQVVEHPELAQYFRVGIDARNEMALLDEQGALHRPDRLVFQDDTVVIIDYKFGATDPSYKQQLDRYESVLESIGYKTSKKILVYVQDKIELQTW